MKNELPDGSRSCLRAIPHNGRVFSRHRSIRFYQGGEKSLRELMGCIVREKERGVADKREPLRALLFFFSRKQHGGSRDDASEFYCRRGKPYRETCERSSRKLTISSRPHHCHHVGKGINIFCVTDEKKRERKSRRRRPENS